MNLSTDSNNNITSFSFAAVSGEVVAINQTAGTIDIEVPCGTERDGLVATFATEGRTVYVATTEQDSGSTENDFTGDVTYRVEACDGTPKSYTVSVRVVCSSDKDITRFTILGRDGTIGENTVTLIVPSGTARSSLTPTITVDPGASISPVSGSSNNFTDPDIEYTVTAADGSEKVYRVTVTNSTDFIMAGTYAAGYYHDGTNNIACLWDLTDPARKKIDLANNAVSSKAASVSVSGDTVYVAGIYNGNACYWKISDGDITAPTPTELDSTGEIMVVDSVILGSDLYISGTNDMNVNSEACYWKIDLTNVNTPAMVPLTSGAGGSAYEIIKSEEIIYIAGTALMVTGYYTPCYWKIESGGDSRHLVYNGIAHGRSVMISGSSRIIGGWFEYDSVNHYKQALTWTYSLTQVPAIELPPVFTSGSSSFSMVSASLNSAGNRYFIGQRTGIACFWLNNVIYNLEGDGPSYAYGIAEINSDIFITGYYTDGTNGPTACVWTNGIAADLPTGVTTEAAAWDVFAKD